MNILVDMNLTPRWVGVLAKHGWTCFHWSAVGDPRATDQEIMQWALDNSCLVFTHDLDFGAILAVTGARGPSVVQVRTQDVLPEHLESDLVQVLRAHQPAIESGALVVLDESRSRVRILPLSENPL